MTAQVFDAQTIDLRSSARKGQGDALVLRAGPRMFPLAIFVLGAVALFFAMIFFRISLDQAAFELDRIETEIAQQESVQLDLRLDLAGLQSPIRIAEEAARIGLVYPDERIMVAATRSVGAPPVPEATTSLSALTGEQP